MAADGIKPEAAFASTWRTPLMVSLNIAETPQSAGATTDGTLAPAEQAGLTGGRCAAAGSRGADQVEDDDDPIRQMNNSGSGG